MLPLPAGLAPGSLRGEATAVLEQFIGPALIDACTVLLQEAFCGRGPVLDFDAEARRTFGSADFPSGAAFVQSLIDQAEETPQQEDRPIWPDRHRVVGPAEMSDHPRLLPRAFTDLVTNFTTAAALTAPSVTP